MDNNFVNIPQEISGKYINDLDFALATEAGSDFYNYWIKTKEDKVKRDIKELLQIKNPNNMDLKAFTMAAMQGLMANPNVRQIVSDAKHYNSNPDQAIASWAISLARATLSELSKQK